MKKDKKNLLKYLQSQNFMTLATMRGKPWVASTYYAVDDHFNLYFISQPDSRHCRELVKNPQVACAIADSHQKVTDKKKGLQIEGSVHEVIEEKEIKRALKLWNAKNPGFEKVINYQSMKTGKIKGKVYRISLSRTKFFNEELYGPEGYKIFD